MTTATLGRSSSAFGKPRPDEPEGAIVRTGGTEYSAPFRRGGSQAVFALRVISVEGGDPVHNRGRRPTTP